MKKPKIAFFDTKPYDQLSFDTVNKKFNFNIQYFKNRLSSKTVALAKDYDVVCAFVNDEMDKQVIESLYQYNIELIALRCAGYNNVDLKSAYKKIHVVRVPAYSPHAVAEHAVALMLSLNRKTHRAYYRTRDNNFSINGFLGFDMYQKTVGVIGTGKIGKVLIKILQGFGMHILAYDVFPDQSFAEKNNFQYVELDQIYEQSDIISLHCPLTNQTKHMINKESLKRMKPNVLIINTSRGQLIDTKALIDSLKKKQIGGAGLDVYEEESEYFFEDFSNEVIDNDVLARLLSFPNVLVTSHQGFFTAEALHNIAETTLQNIQDHFSGQILKNEVCCKCEENPNLKKIQGPCS